MKVLTFKIILLGAVFLVVGCNTIKKLDRSDEYQQAAAYDKPLVLPSDLSDQQLENYYPVPKVSNGRIVGVSTLPPNNK